MRTCLENPKIIALFVGFSIFYSSFHFSIATNAINQGQIIRDGESIVSSSRKFELGFFSPVNSAYRYLGIWYHEVPEQSVVWVANRENPISGGSGVMTLDENGRLVVFDGRNNFVWSSNSSTTKNATAVLQDDGNLVITNNSSKKKLWESFSYPTDTFLPNMEVHAYLGGDVNRTFSSWKNESDPSLGRFSMGVDPRVSPQIVFWEGPKRRWRSGYWDGQIFIGMPYMSSQYLYGFKVINEGNNGYYITYTMPNETDLVRFRIGWDGFGQQLSWNLTGNKWDILQLQPQNGCEVYNFCGSFGICSGEMGSSVCGCTEGYKPRNLDQWGNGNWTGGCVREKEITCGKNESGVTIEAKDRFSKVERIKWPDFADVGKANNEKGCENECLNNCSCNAYVYVKSIGCIVWTGDLVDMRRFKEGGGDLHVRVASSELGNRKERELIVIIVSVAVIFLLFVSAIAFWWYRKRVAAISSWGNRNQVPANNAMENRDYSTDHSGNELPCVERQTGQEFSLLSFGDMVVATNNFSEGNKLGKGGFGSVYKGNLLGEEIAVKRLSRKSGQGLEEFKNEVILIAKLQHRNLVRILGCCIEGDERMLVYEYMPNKSLDSFIFDSSKQGLLDWKKRLTIIEGIARGLVYLHRDSRLMIIHRDLKASNILLDDEMNPKISDFGMAKIFAKNVNEASTSRVVGTYGYIAPEYALEGLFSVKSDVYSFGVLLLEIISGRRNINFRSPECSNIIAYAWDLWYTGKGMELVDPSISESYNEKQVLRCIHIAMLCVQDSTEHRPTMSSVVLMLESESVTLSMPIEPIFTSMGRSVDFRESKDDHEGVSSNDVTISVIIGR